MKFRKKPLVIEAVQFTEGEGAEDAVYSAFGQENFELLGDSSGFMISFTTAHGDVAFAREGDWVVPDSEPGTFYPIKNDVMQATYMPYYEETELHEDSTPSEILEKVQNNLLKMLPASQVELAMAAINNWHEEAVR